MAIHIDNIQNIPNPNTQSPSVFESTTTAFLNSDLPTFITQANSLSDDLSAKWEDTVSKFNAVSGMNSNVDTKYSAILTYASDTLQYRNEAIDARDEIKSYVVPTEATYSPETIDAKIQKTRLDNFLGFNF